METKRERQIMENIQDQRWSDKMAALEANWRATIAETQVEYQQEREALLEKWPSSETEAIVSTMCGCRQTPALDIGTL